MLPKFQALDSVSLFIPLQETKGTGKLCWLIAQFHGVAVTLFTATPSISFEMSGENKFVNVPVFYRA
jgi:hypothetical protein